MECMLGGLTPVECMGVVLPLWSACWVHVGRSYPACWVWSCPCGVHVGWSYPACMSMGRLYILDLRQKFSDLSSPQWPLPPGDHGYRECPQQNCWHLGASQSSRHNQPNCLLGEGQAEEDRKDWEPCLC